MRPFGFIGKGRESNLSQPSGSACRHPCASSWCCKAYDRTSASIGSYPDRLSAPHGRHTRLRKLPEIAKLGYPLLVGTSRKGFLGATLARGGKSAPPEERLWATAATVTASILGGAHIVRVHDVREMAQAARVADCLLDAARCRNFR